MFDKIKNINSHIHYVDVAPTIMTSITNVHLHASVSKWGFLLGKYLKKLIKVSITNKEAISFL